MSTIRPQRSGPPCRNGTVSQAEPPPQRSLSFAMLLLVAALRRRGDRRNGGGGRSSRHLQGHPQALLDHRRERVRRKRHARRCPRPVPAQPLRGQTRGPRARPPRRRRGRRRDPRRRLRRAPFHVRDHRAVTAGRRVEREDAHRRHHEAALPLRGRRRVAAHRAAQKLGPRRGPGRASGRRANALHRTRRRVHDRGGYEGPLRAAADGRAMHRAAIELRVIQMVDASAPDIRIRADIAAHALPNLGSFEESLTSLVHAQGEIRLSAPCPFRIEAPAHASAWMTRSAAANAPDTSGRGAGIPMLTRKGCRLDGRAAGRMR